ncbi:MAG: methyltransferase domain-containing protein [Gammaproteobacteria bacterium]|nr:methyltransferase domain-containing protein [Gammaproteobacteria bacterium]
MKHVRAILKRVRNALGPKASFEQLRKQDQIYLYAGDVPSDIHYKGRIGLSLTQSNRQHIHHDVTARLPLPDACVDVYQSEDVFEHIEPTRLPAVINEIYRVLKPGGILRLSMPDYGCDILQARTLKNDCGEPVFDPGGGGSYENGVVVGGGHVWFPQYESVSAIIDATQFTDVTFYHYYDASGQSITKPIDYTIGYVMRTPDHDSRVRNPYRAMSIVLDCRKESHPQA